MKTNVVILGLEKYDQLKNAQKQLSEFKKSKNVVIKQGVFSGVEVFTDDEAVEQLARELKQANDFISKLQAENKLKNKRRFFK